MRFEIHRRTVKDALEVVLEREVEHRRAREPVLFGGADVAQDGCALAQEVFVARGELGVGVVRTVGVQPRCRQLHHVRADRDARSERDIGVLDIGYLRSGVQQARPHDAEVVRGAGEPDFLLRGGAVVGDADIQGPDAYSMFAPELLERVPSPALQATFDEKPYQEPLRQPTVLSARMPLTGTP